MLHLVQPRPRSVTALTILERHGGNRIGRGFAVDEFRRVDESAEQVAVMAKFTRSD